MTDDPTHRRVTELLEVVRDAPAPPAAPDLDDRVLRSARWQLAARGTVRAIDDLAVVVATGLRWALGTPPRRPAEDGS